MRPLASLVVLCAACSLGTPSPTGQAPTAVTQTTASTTTIPARGGPTPVCSTEEPLFTGDGNAGSAGSSGSDAARLVRVTWTTGSECDRIVFEFASEAGAPAVDPPSASGVMLRRFGVLRVSLGAGLIDTDLFDHEIGTKLVERLYVVSDQAGGLYIDIHLGAAALVRLSGDRAPSRIVVDVTPGGGPYLATPLQLEDLVILDPTGTEVGSPLVVTGYSRLPQTPTANLLMSDGTTLSVPGTGANQEGPWKAFAYLFGNVLPGGATLEIGGTEVLSFTVLE